jgi:branched-subunit amino acid transport protein
VSAWIAIGLVGVGSLALRLAPIVALRDRPVSPAVQRMLRSAAIAALAALTARALVGRASDGGSQALAPALAVAAVVVAARRVRSLAFLVGIGLTTALASAALQSLA